MRWLGDVRAARTTEATSPGPSLIETLAGRAVHYLDSLWYPMVPDSIQLFAAIPSTASRVGRIHALRRHFKLESTILEVQWRLGRVACDIRRAN